MKPDFHSVDELMRQGVTRRIFPGAVLLVAGGGEVLWHKAYGMADLFSTRPMQTETIFDLASLTKPLATTLAVMLLVQQGRLALDRPCRDYLPVFNGNGKERVTLRHLLSHTSGLPAWRPYYLRLAQMPTAQRVDTLREWVLAEPIAAAPGQRADYSDLGFMVVQWIVEQVVGDRLQRFWSAFVAEPLSIDPLFFLAPDRPQPSRVFAATEFCPLRGRLLAGEVHDDNAYMLGGAAGHAGLFGTAQAVCLLLQGLLSCEQGSARHQLFERDVLTEFFQRQFNTAWALGFDTPAEHGSSAGHHFSKGSVGHLGFTGTSFWMDRQRQVITILLTNRVHPSRYNIGIKEFRPGLHDAVMNALQASF
ncbi:MAG: beta-lactamase family protein [Desulfobacterales bacterium]|nr:beta-lactamase family protein [Desulfobacterales bacterium]